MDSQQHVPAGDTSAPEHRHDFQAQSSHCVLEAPIIAVRRDNVVMPGGKTAVREVVEHFGAVAIVALDSEGRIALVEQYRQPVGRRLWELPAGLLDLPGESAARCAARELREEAGVEAHTWHVLSDMYTSPGIMDEAVRIFLARDVRAVPRPEASDEEADMRVQWVPLQDAVDAVYSGRICNGIAMAGILLTDAVQRGAIPRAVDHEFEARPWALAGRKFPTDAPRPRA